MKWCNGVQNGQSKRRKISVKFPGATATIFTQLWLMALWFNGHQFEKSIFYCHWQASIIHLSVAIVTVSYLVMWLVAGRQRVETWVWVVVNVCWVGGQRASKWRMRLLWVNRQSGSRESEKKKKILHSGLSLMKSNNYDNNMRLSLAKTSTFSGCRLKMKSFPKPLHCSPFTGRVSGNIQVEKH